MKKHFFLTLLSALSVHLVYSQTPSKIESMQLFTDVFHTGINDSVIVDSYDVSGVALISDTSEIKTLVALIYILDPVTSIETIVNDASTNFNMLYVTNDNSIPGFFIEDNKVFFTMKGIPDLRDRYVRFKVLNSDNVMLDSISIKILNN